MEYLVCANNEGTQLNVGETYLVKPISKKRFSVWNLANEHCGIVLKKRFIRPEDKDKYYSDSIQIDLWKH